MQEFKQQTSLIDASQAIEMVGSPEVTFVDATWFLPNLPKNAKEEYRNQHIPGAVHFDIDDISDQNSNLPHMYPSKEYFEQCVGNLGISDNSKLVIYDRSHFVASARVWWMFLSFGHSTDNLHVLNGGLTAWLQEDGPCELGAPEIEPQTYIASKPDDYLATYSEIVTNVREYNHQLIDARSPARFDGREPEPRPGLKGGHIPESANLYYAGMIADNGLMREPDEIRFMMEFVCDGKDIPIITTCGSGVTAAVLLLAFYQVRQSDMRLYDGSWTEWATRMDHDS